MQEDDGIARLRVEGRVTQQTVEELKTSCEAGFADHSTLLLELSEVQFVDATGLDVLRSLVRRGAVLVGCSGFLSELLRTNVEDAGAGQEAVQTDEYTREAQLLARLRRGEDEAFTQLVRQYSGRLLATARRMLGNEHDAQDALQEAFLSAFKAIGQFSGTAKLSTWLHRIVVNAALMKLRSRPELRTGEVRGPPGSDSHRFPMHEPPGGPSIGSARGSPRTSRLLKQTKSDFE